MAKEARIRVRLETNQADQDRRRLERGFEQTTRKASDMAGTMGLSMKSVFAGTLGAMGVGKLLGAISNTATARSIKETLIDEGLLTAMGDQAGTAMGALNSRDAVVSRFQRAYGLGLVDDQMVRRAFEHEQKYGAGADARGQAGIRGLLGEDVRNTALDAIWTRIGEVIGEKIKGAVESALRNAVGLPR